MRLDFVFNSKTNNGLHDWFCVVLTLLQIPIVDDEMKKAAGEVKEDGKCGCIGRLCSAVERVRGEGVCRKCVRQIT